MSFYFCYKVLTAISQKDFTPDSGAQTDFGRSMVLRPRLCLSSESLLKLTKTWHCYRFENYVVIVQKSFTAISPMNLSATNIPLSPPTTAVLQKFCKQAIFIEQVSIPYLETGGAALEFPMLYVV